MERGETVVTELDESSRQAIRDRLCTPGDLLRNGGMSVSTEEYESLPDDPNLFSASKTDDPSDSANR